MKEFRVIYALEPELPLFKKQLKVNMKEIIIEAENFKDVPGRIPVKKFIEYLPLELKKTGGIANLNQFIVNFLVDYEQIISPKYKVKKI